MLTKKTVRHGIYEFIYTCKKENRDFFPWLPISLILSHEDSLCIYYTGASKLGALSQTTYKIRKTRHDPPMPIILKYIGSSLVIWLVCTYVKTEKDLKIYKAYSSNSRKTRGFEDGGEELNSAPRRHEGQQCQIDEQVSDWPQHPSLADETTTQIRTSTVCILMPTLQTMRDLCLFQY